LAKDFIVESIVMMDMQGKVVWTFEADQRLFKHTQSGIRPIHNTDNHQRRENHQESCKRITR